MKIQLFLILSLIEIIINDVPTYTLIKGNEPFNSSSMINIQLFMPI